jgi:serpin B
MVKLWFLVHLKHQNQKKKKKRNRTMAPLESDDNESFTNLAKVSLTIAKHLFSKQEYKDNNAVFSPLSLQIVLSIIAAGSEGPTRQQLLDFLRFKSTDHLNSFVSHLLSVILKDATPSCGPCLSCVNGVWIDQSLSLQPSFNQIISSNYKATLSSVDFQTKVCFLIVIFPLVWFKSIVFFYSSSLEILKLLT